MNTAELLKQINPALGGRSRWSRVDNLTEGGKALLDFDPDEVVRIKGYKFAVQVVSVDPAALVLVPCAGARA